MWTDDEIRRVLERLRRQGNDDGRFEAKSCATDIGSSVWESVSAFANTSDGTLLLGISEEDGFRPVNGFNQNRIAAKFMEGMGDGNPQGVRLTNPPQYEISRCEYADKPLLAIDIHENPIEDKPCYVTAKGPKSGGIPAYGRQGHPLVRHGGIRVRERHAPKPGGSRHRS